MSIHKFEMDDAGKATLAMLLAREITHNMDVPVALTCLVTGRDAEAFGKPLLKGLMEMTHPVYAKIARSAADHVMAVMMSGGVNGPKDKVATKPGPQGPELHIKSDMVPAAATPICCLLIMKHLAEIDDAIKTPAAPGWQKEYDAELDKDLAKHGGLAGAKAMMLKAIAKVKSMGLDDDAPPPAIEPKKKKKMDDYLDTFNSNN